MTKTFNITGECYPDLHYMMNNHEKVQEVMKMIEDGDYFIINRLRQYGQTTTCYLLVEMLNKLVNYVPVKMNFRGINEGEYESESQCL